MGEGDPQAVDATMRVDQVNHGAIIRDIDGSRKTKGEVIQMNLN
jgi:hypothetical protein